MTYDLRHTVKKGLKTKQHGKYRVRPNAIYHNVYLSNLIKVLIKNRWVSINIVSFILPWKIPTFLSTKRYEPFIGFCRSFLKTTELCFYNPNNVGRLRLLWNKLTFLFLSISIYTSCLFVFTSLSLFESASIGDQFQCAKRTRTKFTAKTNNE